MLQPQYTNLIEALIALTHQNVQQWVKVEGTKYQYYIKLEHQRLLVDKYFGVQDGTTNTCINLSIFDNKNRLVDEVILCNVLDKPNEFKLLDDLYNEVELQYNQESTKKLSPILTQITQSIQDKLVHQ